MPAVRPQHLLSDRPPLHGLSVGGRRRRGRDGLHGLRCWAGPQRRRRLRHVRSRVLLVQHRLPVRRLADLRLQRLPFGQVHCGLGRDLGAGLRRLRGADGGLREQQRRGRRVHPLRAWIYVAGQRQHDLHELP